MIKIISGKMLSIQQKILTCMMILSISGVFFFLLDNQVWHQLINSFHQPRYIQTLFLGLFSSFMFVGTLFVKEHNVKSVAFINVILVIGSIFLILVFPIPGNGCVVYGLFGITLGLFYSTIFYLGIFGYSSEIRRKVVAFILFSSYLVTYILNELVIKFGLNITLPLIMLFFLSVILLLKQINLKELTSSQSLEKLPFPFKLIFLFSLIIFISYFTTFLVGNGTKFLAFQNQEGLIWLNRITHLLIYLVFCFIGNNISFPRIFNTSIVCTVLAYIFSILPFDNNVLICFFYNTSDALGDILLFTLVPEIVFKHGKRTSILSILILSVAAGIIAASFGGALISQILNGDHILFYGLFLLLFSSYLFIFPYFSKQLHLQLNDFSNLHRTVPSTMARFNHSLKNMIVLISCGIEILKKSQNIADKQMQETFEIITNSVNQMLAMVKTININSEEIKITKKAYKIIQIIDPAINSIQLLTLEKNIRVVKKCDPNIILNCDKKRVQEALYNIIKNSCEAIEREGEIKIEVVEERKKVRCTITDNGKGIPADQLQKIIRPFYTTKRVETYNYGLGLTHCYIVMQQHNGLMEITSEEGKGTCISLLFPISREDRRNAKRRNKNFDCR